MRISDWSSDVCSSDLSPESSAEREGAVGFGSPAIAVPPPKPIEKAGIARKSVVEGKSVAVRVDLGGRRIIKKKKNQTYSNIKTLITRRIEKLISRTIIVQHRTKTQQNKTRSPK